MTQQKLMDLSTDTNFDRKISEAYLNNKSEAFVLEMSGLVNLKNVATINCQKLAVTLEVLQSNFAHIDKIYYRLIRG